jgi:hypothetical protein
VLWLGAVAEFTLLGAVSLAPMNSWHQTRLLKVVGSNSHLTRQLASNFQYAVVPFLSCSGISSAGTGVEQFGKSPTSRTGRGRREGAVLKILGGS